ncbi:hypothetical protein SJAV_09090 [Sulfurisphaera javensis]|uniref:HTH arsR-type domain-containing protein n=2 Tax=Sulfurisphaera javensis TaxID=2049879 RepID=A0AAT9GPU9_9CREN
MLFILLLMPLISKGDSGTINIYYNGTIVAELHNVSEFTLIGEYAGDLRVVGAEYNLSGNHLFLRGNGTIYVFYRANLPKGVIQMQENQNFTVNVFLPTNASITYISPQPYSFTAVNGFYNITFTNTNKITILYAELIPQVKSNEDTEFYLVIALIILDVILISGIVYLIKGRKQKETLAKDEEAEVVTEVLDERDKIVLEAIKDGSITLAEIIRKTGLPKATAYRRVKKLVKLGYVEEIREGGKVKYALKKKD